MFVVVVVEGVAEVFGVGVDSVAVDEVVGVVCVGSVAVGVDGDVVVVAVYFVVGV